MTGNRQTIKINTKGRRSAWLNRRYGIFHSIVTGLGGNFNGNMNAQVASAKRSLKMSALLIIFLAAQVLSGPLAVLTVAPALAQTRESDPGQQGQGEQDPEGKAKNTEGTVRNPYYNSRQHLNEVERANQINQRYVSGQDGPRGVNGPFGAVDRIITGERTNVVFQAAEQNQGGDVQKIARNSLNASLGSINDTYRGLHQWFKDDLVGNLFTNIGQLIGKWLSELINGWIADSVQYLAQFLRIFVLNPNVAVNGLNGKQNDGISPYIRQGADVMYGIAVDLLLLLFILCIWKYWAEASWKGAGNLMGPVGRLIFTAGLLLAWPTIYAFEVQITNEMIKAIYFNSNDQLAMLHYALATTVKGGLIAAGAGALTVFAPILGNFALGAAAPMVGSLFYFASLVVFTILGGVLIAELVYLLVLKAIQTALLVAQYMFAPIFLVFFATPDTENIASGYVKAFVETSLWTFVWVGLLKVMVIIIYSNFNPWGKILIAIGVLQLMIQVPSFLARAQISPMSDFISAGLVTGGLFKAMSGLGGILQSGIGTLIGKQIEGKMLQGMLGSTTSNQTGLGAEAANPQLLNNLNRVSETERNRNGGPGSGPGGGPGGPGGPTPPPMKPPSGAGAALPPKPKPATLTPLPTGSGAPGGDGGGSGGGDGSSGPPIVSPPSKPGDGGAALPLPPVKPTTAVPPAKPDPKPDPSSPPGSPPLKPLPGSGGAALPLPGTDDSTSSASSASAVSGAPDASLAGGPGSKPASLPVSPTGKPTTPGAGDGSLASGTGSSPSSSLPVGPGPRPLGFVPLAAAAAGAGLAAAGARAAGAPNATGSGAPGGGGAGGGRGDQRDQYRWESSSAEGWDEKNLINVPVRKLIGKLTSVDGVGIRTGQKETGVLGTADHGVQRVNIANGADGAEISRAMYTAAFADQVSHDDPARDAARRAAFAAGAHKPQGFKQSLIANWMEANGKSWYSTPWAKENFNRAMFSSAVEGSSAFIRGDKGNAYTDYLRGRFGDWDADGKGTQDAMAVHLITNPESAESPWNRNIGPATENLIQSGIPISMGSRGAMQNMAIQAMHPARRKQAVFATLSYLYPQAKELYGNEDPAVFNLALGEMARALPAEQVNTALAMYQQTGQADLRPEYAAPVAALAADTGREVPLAYSSLATAAPYVAQQMGRVRSGTNINAIRTIADLDAVIQPANGETHTQAFQTVMETTSQALKTGEMHGIPMRTVMNPDVAPSLYEFMGGDIAHMNTPNAHQKMRIVARNLGTIGTSNDARTLHAIHTMVQSGTSLNSLDADHINVGAQLVDSGVSGKLLPHAVEVALKGGYAHSGQPLPLAEITGVAQHYASGQVSDYRYVPLVSQMVQRGMPVSNATLRIAGEAITDIGADNSRTLNAIYTIQQAGGNLGQMHADHIRVGAQLIDGGITDKTLPHAIEVAMRGGYANPGSGALPVGEIAAAAQHYASGQVSDYRYVPLVAQMAQSKIQVSNQNLRIAAEAVADNGGQFNADHVRAVIRVGQGLRSSAMAPNVVETFVRAQGSHAGIINANDLPLHQVIGELETRGIPMSSMASTISTIQRGGGFSDHQMQDQTAVELMLDNGGAQATREQLQAVNVVTRIVGADQAAQSPRMVEVTTEYLANNGKMKELDMRPIHALIDLDAQRQVVEAQAAGMAPGDPIRADLEAKLQRFSLNYRTMSQVTRDQSYRPGQLSPQLWNQVFQ